MREKIDYVDENGTWYKTDERRREDGKIRVRMTLSSEYDIRWLTHNLSKEVRRLKLSRRLLFYLMHYKIVDPSLEEVNRNFNQRLDDFSFGKMEQVMSRKDQKMVWITIPPSSLFKTHQRIEQEAVTYIHEHRKHYYLWNLWNSLPDRFKEFRVISEEIIRNTNPKEARSADLSEKQKVWFWCSEIPPNPIEYVGGGGPGTPTIESVFERMLTEYNWMIGQLSKYKEMTKWLEKNYPGLHEFYLHGKDRIGAKDKIAPSMRERLKSLDEVVNSKYVDLAMIEIAFSQLKRLIEDDLLFTCVFYSYFYKSEKGLPPELKRKALERAKPYVYYLKFFTIQPIPWNGIKIRSRYKLGVLLLNALAGEEIYKVGKVSIWDVKKKKYRDQYEFPGAEVLRQELQREEKHREGVTKSRKFG
jgi:hypothetical protein